MTQLLDLPAEVQREIFGAYDNYIRKVEKDLNVTIIARDGRVKVIGDEKDVRGAVAVLRQLASLSERGSGIEEQKVDYALEMRDEAPSDMLLKIDADTI